MDTSHWKVLKERLKEKYLPHFHKAHLVDQIFDFKAFHFLRG